MGTGRPGELVSFDTDMIGPFGYCADISRTYFCGPGRPSHEQRRLYRLAWEQIHYNMDLLGPGLGFREFAEKAFQMPEAFAPNRYSVLVHGVGMADEYPHCPYLVDFETSGYDEVFEPGMTVCVESYVGEVGGEEGVKLEQQVLVTETGVELLSTYPFEDELLDRQI
jgi:Xaa-Pro aminopeptidase